MSWAASRSCALEKVFDRHMGPIEEQVEAELVLVSVRTPYFADA
jgi:hypothetical protein